MFHDVCDFLNIYYGYVRKCYEHIFMLKNDW